MLKTSTNNKFVCPEISVDEDQNMNTHIVFGCLSWMYLGAGLMPCILRSENLVKPLNEESDRGNRQ